LALQAATLFTAPPLQPPRSHSKKRKKKRKEKKRKGKERKGKERKGKERKGKERKEKYYPSIIKLSGKATKAKPENILKNDSS
jgi:hypothetical protein